MKFNTSKIIDSNSGTFRVGWDKHGCFSIQAVNLYPWRLEFDTDDTINTDNGLMDVVVKDENFPSFSPGEAEKLIEAIEEGL